MSIPVSFKWFWEPPSMREWTRWFSWHPVRVTKKGFEPTWDKTLNTEWTWFSIIERVEVRMGITGFCSFHCVYRYLGEKWEGGF